MTVSLRIGDGDSESCSLQLARDVRSSSNGRIVNGAATLGATSCEDSNGDEASAEKEVKEKAKESEEGDTAEKAGKDDSERGIDDGSTSHTLDGLLPFWNMEVVIC